MGCDLIVISLVYSYFLLLRLWLSLAKVLLNRFRFIFMGVSGGSKQGGLIKIIPPNSSASSLPGPRTRFVKAIVLPLLWLHSSAKKQSWYPINIITLLKPPFHSYISRVFNFNPTVHICFQIQGIFQKNRALYLSRLERGGPMKFENTFFQIANLRFLPSSVPVDKFQLSPI